MSTSTTIPSVKSFDTLPGPFSVPLLGSPAALKLSRLHQTLERWASIHGPIYSFRLGPKPVVVVAEASTAMDVLRERPEKYRRLTAIESVFDELGTNGVFSREGEDWRRQRRITMQAFQPQHLRAFMPTLTDITRRFRQRWIGLAQNGEAFNATHELTRYTVDVVTAFALGHDLRTLDGHDDSIQRHLEKLFPAINRRVSAAFPYWRFVKLPRDRALDRSLQVVQQTVSELIARARDRCAAEPDRTAQNFLEALLLARDEDGTAFSDADIVANALTMLLAGEDTTAHTLAWALYFLRERTDIQERLHREIGRTLIDDAALTNSDLLESLPFLDALIQETMRLKPVAPLIFLEALTDVCLKGYELPRGTALFVATRPPGLDPSVFPEPGAFMPERWLNETAPDQAATQRRMLRPFGGGPRFCPGRTLALWEIKHALAVITQNFNVLPPANASPVQEVFSFAMMPANLQVRLVPREQNASVPEYVTPT